MQKRPKKQSDYGIELERRRNIKQEYGVNKALDLSLLERRLDNAVYRLGFATTRPAARQLVSHRGIIVNTRVVNIPSFLVKEGDKVILKKTKQLPETFSKHKAPAWIKLDKKKFIGEIIGQPQNIIL